MAVISLAGVVMCVVVMSRFKPGEGRGTLDDVLTAAGSAVHTVPPPSASGPASGSEPLPGSGAGSPQPPPPASRP